MNQKIDDWEEMSQEERKRANVQRVLDCHNGQYGTNFRVVGRSVDLYPELKHPSKDWDWVCRDSVSGVEGAVEVKNLTHRGMERAIPFISDILREVCDIVGCKVEGRFYLSGYGSDEPIELRGPKRTRFVKCLADVVRSTALNLGVGASSSLTAILRQSFPELPRTWRFALKKHDGQGAGVPRALSVAVGPPPGSSGARTWLSSRRMSRTGTSSLEWLSRREF